jgi:hypothetical protein
MLLSVLDDAQPESLATVFSPHLDLSLSLHELARLHGAAVSDPRLGFGSKPLLHVNPFSFRTSL